MSTPLFIGTPQVGASRMTVNDTKYYLLENVAEATLVEEVRIVANDFSTDAGRVRFFIEEAATAGTYYSAGAYEIAAGTATLEATDAIELNLAIPVGWSLLAEHNIQTSGGGGDALVSAIACGGVLR